jgi:hypothetical protein
VWECAYAAQGVSRCAASVLKMIAWVPCRILARALWPGHWACSCTQTGAPIGCFVQCSRTPIPADICVLSILFGNSIALSRPVQFWSPVTRVLGKLCCVQSPRCGQLHARPCRPATVSIFDRERERDQSYSSAIRDIRPRFVCLIYCIHDTSRCRSCAICKLDYKKVL